MLLLLHPVQLLNPLTEPEAAQMAEWNAYYRNEDEEEEQEEGEQSGGEIKASSLLHVKCKLVKIIRHLQSTLILAWHVIITLCILPIRGLYLTLHAMQSSM